MSDLPKKSRVGIAWPSKIVQDILNEDQHVEFMMGNVWLLANCEGASRRFYPVGQNFSCSYPSKINVQDIRRSLHFWTPILTRWSGYAEYYDEYNNHIVTSVHALISDLLNLKLDVMIFHTGVPHHLDSVILSIACELVGLSQVFLYAQVIDGSLLPLIQSQGIFSRKPLGLNISDCVKEHAIEEFLRIKNQTGFAPMTTINSLSRNYTYGLVYLSVWKFRVILSRLKTSLMSSSPSESIYLTPKDYSFASFIRIINNQRDFIYSYRQMSVDGDTLDLSGTQMPIVLIVAHYQPEATSFPEGGYFYSHVDVVAAIRSKGYTGRIIYKEHPVSCQYVGPIVGLTRVGIYRSVKYLQSLQLFGCEFLEENFPLSNDPDKCYWYIPVTISGTIAIERSLMGMRTIIFGEPWFRKMPGIIHISEITTLEKIDPLWVKSSESLAIAAKTWLNETLSRRTLTNCPGIGSGKQIKDPDSVKKFSSELLALVEHLKLNPCAEK
jgi:hypothetical protein